MLRETMIIESYNNGEGISDAVIHVKDIGWVLHNLLKSLRKRRHQTKPQIYQRGFPKYMDGFFVHLFEAGPLVIMGKDLDDAESENFSTLCARPSKAAH